MALTYSQLVHLTGNKLGRHDVACPECGPDRKSKINQKREVLRVWLEEEFASFHCARCGASGYAHAEGQTATSISAPALKPAAEVLSDEERAAEQLRKARYFWSCSTAIQGTVAEIYLRECRGITCALPATVRYLKPRKATHHDALIASFGMPTEHEPGRLSLQDGRLCGVHLTFLAKDGHGKAAVEPNKIMLGRSAGNPIVLAPPNDGLALGIGEGIETMLSMHQQTGVGVWAAGCASRLPALAEKVPNYIEVVTIAVEDDVDGRRHATHLSERLSARGIEARMANA
jgi:hypothetical protein